MGDEDQAPDGAESPAEPMPEADAEMETEEEASRKPFYLRPVLIVSLLVLLLIIFWLVSPALAEPVQVGLDEDGDRFLEDSHWFVNDDRNTTASAFGGLVHVDSVQLSRNVSTETHETAAVYLWANVKIPAMLPRAMVEERMREIAIEQMEGSHVEVSELPESGIEHEGNGQNFHITYHNAVAREESAFRHEVELDVFIATWRCSVMGSYAVAVGIALRDYSGFEELTAADADPFHEMQERLLPHTVCSQ